MDMSFYIDVEDGAGNKLGSGPITSAEEWEYTARIDRAGDFAFWVPSADPKTQELVNGRKVRAWALLNGVWTEVGAGVIDDVNLSVTPDGRVMLKVSGLSEERELSYRSVGFLELASAGSSVSHAAAIGSIGAFAPAGWSFAPDPSPPVNSVYARYAGESVLQAIIKAVQQSRTHFYRSGPRQLTFASAFTPSSVRAIQARGDLQPETAAITRISAQRRTYERLTRIHPFGFGQGRARLTLAATNRSAPAGYTLNAAQNWIQNNAADVAFGRIERWLEYKDLGPVSNTDADMQAAANALFDVAFDELQRRSEVAEQRSYTLSLAECGVLLRPLQTLRAVFRDPDQHVEIDETLNILEATWRVDSNQLRTTQVVVSNVDRWAEDDASALASDMERGHVFAAHPQANANSDTISYNKTVDETETASFRWRFRNNVTQLQRVLFEFQLLPLESNVKSLGTETGGSGAPTGGPNINETGTGGTGDTGFGGGGATGSGGGAATGSGGGANTGGSGTLTSSSVSLEASSVSLTTGSGGESETGSGGGAATGSGGGTSTGSGGGGNTGFGGDGETVGSGTLVTNVGGFSETASGGPTSTGSSGAGDTGGSGTLTSAGSGTLTSAGSGTLTSSSTSLTTGSGGGGATGSGGPGTTDGVGLSTEGPQGGDIISDGQHGHGVVVFSGSGNQGNVTLHHLGGGNYELRNSSIGGAVQPQAATLSGNHTHAVASHIHSISPHTHGISAHTHTLPAHTHTIEGHTHTIAGHNHTIAAHTHTIPSHTHTVAAHTHSLATHTHSMPSHTHFISEHTHALTAHTHTTAAHTHTTAAHTHTTAAHTHTTAAHTHTVAAHTHTIAAHTHTVPSHTHTTAAHTHTTATHTHSLSDHTHSLNNHTHSLAEAIVALYGIFREEAANTFALADLEYQVNNSSWFGLETSANVGDGWRQLDITAAVQNANNFRPLQSSNVLRIRRKSSGATEKTAQIDAQLCIDNTIQAIIYN